MKINKYQIRSYCFNFLIFISLIGIGLLYGTKHIFGDIDIEKVLFHLNMPYTSAVSRGLVIRIIYESLSPPILIFITYCYMRSFFVDLFLEKRHQNIRFYIDLIFSIPLLFFFIYSANSLLKLDDYLYYSCHQSDFIQKNYVNPKEVQITFPKHKRNLIYISVESLESSVQDIKNGGLLSKNLIPELTQIARQNVSFSHSNLLEGAAMPPRAGWTIAGLFAQTAGLPLKLPIDFRNSMDHYHSFFNDLSTLGDILQQAGYKNFLISGSDFTFAGGRNYFTKHGNYQIWDYLSAKNENKIPFNYRENWGFEDSKLYQYAKEQLLLMAKSSQPFCFIISTLDTHPPEGYQEPSCPRLETDDLQNAYRCTSIQLNDFIQWVQKQDFYKNTTIVILGDHCNMNEDLIADVPSDFFNSSTDRKIYNIFINAPCQPIQEENRRFTTLDMFPTILSALGVQIKGERLGLGVNLFSDTPTLAEQFGYEVLFEELKKKSDFYNSLLYAK